MPKRWTLEQDIFLVQYHAMGADFIASHDLGRHSKGSGERRVKALKEAGVWEKIEDYIKANRLMVAHHRLAFSKDEFSIEMAMDAIEEFGDKAE